jgi:hypothetical protein
MPQRVPSPREQPRAWLVERKGELPSAAEVNAGR